MLDHLRGLAVLAAVAEAGSFRAAAKRLGLSASVVSHYITGLENRLNTPLIYRTTRRLSLTDAGARLADNAKMMVKIAEEGFASIGHQSPNPVGRLKITAPAILQYARFVTRVSTFMRHHPNVEISLKFTDRQINIVEEGLDLAFRVGQLKDSSLISRKLADGKLHVCASPDYLERQAVLKAPGDLEHLELIDLAGVSRDITFTASGEQQIERIARMKHRISVDSGFAARRMAEAGCGVVMLPDFFVRESLKSRALVEVLPEWQAPIYGIYAVWPPNAATNQLRSSFLNFIAAIARTEADTDTQIDLRT